jgi:hypothetical protein
MHIKTKIIIPNLVLEVSSKAFNRPNAQAPIDGEQADPRACQVAKGQATEAKKTKYPRAPST